MKYQCYSNRSRLLALFLSFLLVAGLVGCSGNEAPTGNILTCSVAVDNLNVHKKASADSRVLGQLPLDLEIEILEQTTAGETDWGRIGTVKLPDGKTVKAGWIDLHQVEFPGEAEDQATEPAEDSQNTPAPVTVNMGTVTAGKLNIRKGPDSKYETVEEAYYNGDRIEILETQTIEGTVWGRTNLGWVGMGYVKMDGTAASASDEDPNALKIISNGNTEVLGYGVIDLGELNVRQGPSTDYDKVGTAKQGVRYAYYQLSTTSGSWARIEGGWVSTEYFYIEGTAADDSLTGTVTEDDLNIRSGPNTSFQSTGTYMKGETVKVLAQVGAWGYTEKGWVFMNYVEPNAPTYSTGICKVIRGLNIRKEPNAEAEIVGSYTEGDGVNILEVEGNWGRTIQGWINLQYVEYEDSQSVG